MTNPPDRPDAAVTDADRHAAEALLREKCYRYDTPGGPQLSVPLVTTHLAQLLAERRVAREALAEVYREPAKFWELCT